MQKQAHSSPVPDAQSNESPCRKGGGVCLSESLKVIGAKESVGVSPSESLLVLGVKNDHVVCFS